MSDGLSEHRNGDNQILDYDEPEKLFAK